jgi:hypothetical protein
LENSSPLPRRRRRAAGRQTTTVWCDMVLGDNDRREQAGMIRRLELRRGQVAQRRMDALVLVHLFQEAPDLRVGVSEIAILG